MSKKLYVKGYPIWAIYCLEKSKRFFERRYKYNDSIPSPKIISLRVKVLKSGLCEYCGEFFFKKLEFAHIEATGLRGQGRGMKTRYYDFLRNRSKYMLLCHDCHRKLDNEMNPNH